MQRGRILVLVGAVTAAAAGLFPFFTAPTIGDVRNGIHLLPLAALGVAALVAAAGDRGESLTGLPAVAAAAAVTGALVLTGAFLIDATVAGREAKTLGLEATVGTGLWLTGFGTVLAIAGVGIAMSRRLS